LLANNNPDSVEFPHRTETQRVGHAWTPSLPWIPPVLGFMYVLGPTGMRTYQKELSAQKTELKPRGGIFALHKTGRFRNTEREC
jgi:hypothetical protein